MGICGDLESRLARTHLNKVCIGLGQVQENSWSQSARIFSGFIWKRRLGVYRGFDLLGGRGLKRFSFSITQMLMMLQYHA